VATAPGARAWIPTGRPGRALDWLRRRPATAAALVYLVLVLAFVGPALLPGKTLSSSDTLWFSPPWLSEKPAELVRPTNTDLNDAPQQLQPFLRWSVERLPHIPLWNPYIDSGRPFLANSQAAVFSPFSLPAYVLPFWTALPWIAVIKLWVAAFGTFLLGRALGMRFAGALLAGIVFAFSFRMTSWLIYNNDAIWALIPWLLLCTDRLVRRADALVGAGLAVVVALLFLAGHPETSVQALFAAVPFLALRLWQRRRAGEPGQPILRPVLVFCAGLVGGLALAAMTLIPLAELILQSADLHERAGASVDVHVQFKEVIGLFMPDYWGRPTQVPIRPLIVERAMYVGALPLLLTVVALTLRRTTERVWIAAFAGFWFAVVMGVPPFLQVVTRLPFFSSGHNSRLIILPIFAVALLAGWGLDDLASGERFPRRRRLTALALSAVVVVGPLVFFVAGRRASPGDLADALKVALLLAHPPGQYGQSIGAAVIRFASLIDWLVLAGAGLALLALRLRGRLPVAPFLVLAVVLVCLDLFRIGMGFNPAIDRTYASQPATGAIRYLERQRPARFVSTEEFPQNTIPMRYRLYEARGYDLPILRRYDRLWRREVFRGTNVAAGLFDIPLRFPGVDERSLRTLRLLGVTHILRAKAIWPGKPPYDQLIPYPPLKARGLTQVYDGRDARVYRVEGALPRAFVVGGQRVVGSGEAALDAVTGAGFDGRRVAVTEGRVAGLPVGVGAGSGSARVVSYGPERVVVRARSSGAGLLVLGDNWYPGWRAYVDGRRVPIERVDYLFRGVRVGAGQSTVEFRYQPLSWRIGWIVSLTALAGLAAATGIGIQRRRRPRAFIASPGRRG
jgi:Bacterial membrane protein YfhO